MSKSNNFCIPLSAVKCMSTVNKLNGNKVWLEVNDERKNIENFSGNFKNP